MLTLLAHLDVVFPVLHGTFGEDGTLQGLFEMADLAYVGAGVVGSSVGMDKGIFQSVMQANHIPVLETMVVLRRDLAKQMNEIITSTEKMAPYPLFTKPANLGSSVGVSKCGEAGCGRRHVHVCEIRDNVVIHTAGWGRGMRGDRPRAALLSDLQLKDDWPYFSRRM